MFQFIDNHLKLLKQFEFWINLDLMELMLCSVVNWNEVVDAKESTNEVVQFDQNFEVDSNLMKRISEWNVSVLVVTG